MFLPPITYSFPLLPGFSFGKNPTSYPVHNDSHISHRVLTFKSYAKRGDSSEPATMRRNLTVLFRALAFYIDLQGLPGFWNSITEAWNVTDVDNTKSIVNFYANRHLDWARDPEMSTNGMMARDKVLVDLAGYWCKHRDKTIRQSGPNDKSLFRHMAAEWSYLRDRRRGLLFEAQVASLRKFASNVPKLTISDSFPLQGDKKPARCGGQSQESNGTRASRTDPLTESKSSQSSGGGYTEQRDPRHRSRSFSVPRGAQPMGASSSESQRSQPPVNEPVASQPSETCHIMAGGHQQQHGGYIASQPFQVNPSQLEVSQSLDSSCPQSQELPVITKSVTPANDTKDTTPKPRAKNAQPKEQVPLSPKRIKKEPTSSTSSSTGSDGDSEESESGSESETESSSIYQDTGSGAEPGVIQRFKRDHIPRRVTRSLTSSPSGNSSDSGDSSDSSSDSDMNDKVDGNNHQRVSDNVGESSSCSGSGSGSESYSSSGDSNDGVSDNKGRSSRNTNEGSSVNDSDGSSDGSDDDNDDSDDDSDGSEDESDSEPEPPKPLTPKNPGIKKPAKTTVEASTRGEKKAWSSDDMSEEEEEIKSEPDSDSSVPMASIPTKDQEPPTSAQRASVPPTKRRREEDEVEKPTAGGRPAAKRRATTQQQSSPSEKTKSSEARRRDRKKPTEAPCGEGSSKSRRFAENESSPLLEQMFKDLPQIESEHKRSIDMLTRRLDALEENNMRQDKKIAKQDRKIVKQNKKIIRQDEKINKQNKKITKQDKKMMK